MMAMTNKPIPVMKSYFAHREMLGKFWKLDEAGGGSI